MSEFTPVYTRAEKIKKILWLSPLIILIGVGLFVVFPWVNTTNWFLCTPQALDYFYIFLGSFPLAMIISVLCFLRTNLRIIRLKQYPLPEQKTWTAQPYRYGLKATWRSYGSVIMIPILFCMSFWSFSVTQDLKNAINPDKLQQLRAIECQNKSP